jgi:hypothetical protein
MTTRTLPAGFEALEPFVAEWALLTERERMLRRIHGTMDEIGAFYKALTPHIPALLEHLEAYPPRIEELPADVQRLAALGLSYMECSRIFEMWGKQDVHHNNFAPERLGFAPLGRPAL